MSGPIYVRTGQGITSKLTVPLNYIGINKEEPQATLDVEGYIYGSGIRCSGAIIAGDTTINIPGSIRFNGNDLEGYNGIMWISLTSGAFLTDVNGGIFIYDIYPTDSGNVSEKVYSTDGYSLESCLTSVPELRVLVKATTGHTNYKPILIVNNENVTNLIETSGQMMWSGYVDIIVSGTQTIYASHEDNATDECLITYQPAPIVQFARFTGGYPGSQSELKEGDTFLFYVEANNEFNAVEIQDTGAFQYSLETLGSSVTNAFVTGIIADRGDIVSDYYGFVKLRDSYGSFGPQFDTSSSGVVDGVSTVKLNNIYPTITFSNIDYPGTQEAIKDSESATGTMTISDINSIYYSSPTSQISITNPSLNETEKIFTRIAGDYNISITNVIASGHRIGNDTFTISSGIVKIANIDAQLQVTEESSRLKSGGNQGTSAQNHVITITSDQQLYESPTLTAPTGVWQSSGFVGGPTIYTRSIQIHDNDEKGIYTWGVISGVNLAHKITSGITGNDTYELGGFAFRTLTVPAWPNRETSIGTRVSDSGKLECTNLSKGDTGSLNFSYKSNTDNLIDFYTITDPTIVANPTGNIWYNCDLANAVSNTGGTMQIELEETI